MDLRNNYDLKTKTLKEVVQQPIDIFQAPEGVYVLIGGDRFLVILGRKWFFKPGPNCGADISGLKCLLCEQKGEKEPIHDYFTLTVLGDDDKKYTLFECRVQMLLYFLERD